MLLQRLGSLCPQSARAHARSPVCLSRQDTIASPSSTHTRRGLLTLQPLGQSFSRRHAQVVCRAGDEDTDNPVEQVDKQVAETVEEQTSGRFKLQPGQGTAIVTGAISLILGIAYLAFVSFVDSRGGGLQPPPPEAYGF
ncbi:hypothetical protein WJX73_001715 [Symbiochloris irregularis]|uniref:Uncharacterized protein n=1 Tax=Symbiochloris irregularis TaxID=706552 RepID=A0AAW1PG49_9CHLO